jgi:hypothetical protein
MGKAGQTGLTDRANPVCPAFFCFHATKLPKFASVQVRGRLALHCSKPILGFPGDLVRFVRTYFQTQEWGGKYC